MVEWDSALRKLTREHPKENHLTAILDAMRSHTPDRGCALVAASHVELTLQLAIIHALALKGEDAINDLFYKFGPMSSFDAKIVICVATGILGANSAENLTIIKNIRNAFAHAMLDVEFTTPEIARACTRLKLNSESMSTASEAAAMNTSRYRYCLACNEIYCAIFGYIIPRFLANEFATRTLLGGPILP